MVISSGRQADGPLSPIRDGRQQFDEAQALSDRGVPPRDEEQVEIAPGPQSARDGRPEQIESGDCVAERRLDDLDGCGQLIVRKRNFSQGCGWCPQGGLRVQEPDALAWYADAQ